MIIRETAPCAICTWFPSVHPMQAVCLNMEKGAMHHGHKHEEHRMHDDKEAHPGSARYYCPMRCEGDKTYDKPGDCPVCGMHLQKEAGTGSRKNVMYTCPMHPEVKQDSPGACPKCGMNLVPEKGEEASEEDRAYREMLKKFIVAVILSIPVLIIAMSPMIPFIHLENIASQRIWNWVEFCAGHTGGILCRPRLL